MRQSGFSSRWQRWAKRARMEQQAMQEDEREERDNGQTRGQKIAEARPTPADRGDGVQMCKIGTPKI